MSGSVASPCIRLCRLGDEGCCIGCGRTPPEVGEWYTADDARKRAIRAAADARMDRLYGDGGGVATRDSD